MSHSILFSLMLRWAYTYFKNQAPLLNLWHFLPYSSFEEDSLPLSFSIYTFVLWLAVYILCTFISYYRVSALASNCFASQYFLDQNHCCSNPLPRLIDSLFNDAKSHFHIKGFLYYHQSFFLLIHHHCYCYFFLFSDFSMLFDKQLFFFGHLQPSD